MEKAQNFKDKEIATSIERYGFCKTNLPINAPLDEFVEIAKKVELTKGRFEGRQNEIANVSFHSSFLDKNKEYKDLVWRSFSESLRNLISQFFIDFKIIQINIFNKPSGSGYVCPHQNLSVVDERIHSSYSVWIPLQNVDITNGRLQFIKSSHKKFEKFRSAEIYWRPLAVFEENLEKLPFIGVDTEKGTCLIFDDSIVHYSEDNFSKHDRVILHCVVAPSVATCIYPQIKGDGVCLYKVSDDFWKYHTPGDSLNLCEIHDLVEYPTREYDFNKVINEINSEVVYLD